MKPSRTNSRRPDPRELSLAKHRDFVARVDGDCVLKVLADQLYWICELASHLSAQSIDKIHSPYTWTVRQVIEHVTDAERIFGDRMLRIAAGDPTDLPPWDENAYAAAKFGLGNLTHLVSELGHLRQANLILLNRLNAKAWDQAGSVAGNRISTRGVAWIAAAHLQHHFEIIEQRIELSVQRKP